MKKRRGGTMGFFGTKQDTTTEAANTTMATEDRTEKPPTKDDSQAPEPPIDISIVEATTAEPAAAIAAITAAPADTATPLASAATTPSTGDATAEPGAITESVEIEPEVIEAPAAGPTFGIADAIQLMRSLPHDPNMDLVVRIVRVTLDAVNVSVQDIMDDAHRKEQSLTDGIAVLQSEVEGLEKQLYARRCEIAAREAELKETVSVRERLNQADKYSGHRPPPPPPDAIRILHPKAADETTEWEISERAGASK